jgi:glycosyltransferase involved in cell wall biosynthesis
VTRSKGSLKIGVDARSLIGREPRGEGKSLLRLYQEILQLRPDIKVVFFGDRSTHNFQIELPAGVTVISAELPGERISAWENIYFPVAATITGCNLLHCASSGGPFWSLQPQLLTIHDMIPLCFDDGQSSTEIRTFMNRLKNGLRNAKRIITVSGHTKQDLLKIFPTLQTPVDIIHWGSDFTIGQDCHTLPPPIHPYIISFGGEAKRKNTTYTLERFIAIAKKLPTLKLYLIGVNNKMERERLSSIALHAGLADRVILSPFISESELDTLIRNAAALLYLSLYEGFGLPLLEAVGRGVPVIASNCTSIPEILDGIPGCFSLDNPQAIEDAIITLVTSPEDRNRWRLAQGQVLPQFDWKNTAALTIEALESCVQ